MEAAGRAEPIERQAVGSRLDEALGRSLPARLFTVSVGLITLHLLSALAVRGAGRSGLGRLGSSLLVMVGSFAAVASFRRSGRLLQGGLALLIGSAATIVGVGITVARMAKVGISAADYTGMLSLLAGGVLLLLGSGVILAGVRPRRRVLAIPVGILAFYYFLAPLMLAVYVTHVPATAHSGRTPADVGLSYRDVTMRTSDGISLSGWYLPSRNGAAVVVLHGSGSTRSEVLDHIAVLARHDYGVLAIDARGHGDSGGVAMDLGWYGVLDVDAAISFVARQPDVDAGRIGVLGLSMGGDEALTAAAGDHRIQAVVAEGASAHSFADVGSLGLEGALNMPFYGMAFAAADLMSPARPPMGLEAAVAGIGPRPVLLISDARGTESILNRRYQAAAPASTQLWELPDTDHTHGIWTHPDQWARRVVGFLGQALLG